MSVYSRPNGEMIFLNSQHLVRICDVKRQVSYAYLYSVRSSSIAPIKGVYITLHVKIRNRFAILFAFNFQVSY